MQAIIKVFSIGGNPPGMGSYGPFASFQVAAAHLHKEGWKKQEMSGPIQYWVRGPKRDGFVHATIQPLLPIAAFPHKPEKSLSTRRGRS